MTQPAVVHRPDQGRFEISVEGLSCMLSYRVEGGTMVLLRTAVPRPLEGRGLAARLVEAALQHAQAQGLTLQSRCSYVTSYLRAHPQPAGRLATGAAPAATGLVPHSSNESQTRWN